MHMIDVKPHGGRPRTAHASSAPATAAATIPASSVLGATSTITLPRSLRRTPGMGHLPPPPPRGDARGEASAPQQRRSAMLAMLPLLVRGRRGTRSQLLPGLLSLACTAEQSVSLPRCKLQLA